MGLREEVKIILGLEGAAGVEAGLDRVTNKLGKSNASLQTSTKGLASSFQILSRTVLPELNGIAGTTIGLIGDLKGASAAAGVGFGTLAAGIGAAAVPIYLTANAYRELAAAMKLEAQAKADQIAGRERSKKALEEELELMRKAGLITEQERRWALTMDDPYSGPTTDLTVVGQRLKSLRTREGVAPESPFDAAKRKAQLELLDGTEKELALIDQRYQTQVNENKELTRRQQLTAEQLAELNRLASADRELKIGKLAAKEGDAYRLAVAKQLTEEAKAEAEALKEAEASARQMADDQQRRADFMRGMQYDRIGMIGSMTTSPSDAAAAEGNQAYLRYEDQITQINALRYDSEEEYYALVEQAAELHSLRMTDIYKRQGSRERDLNMMRLGAAGEMFGGMAAVAKMYGKEGFIAYKALSIAQAVIATFTAANTAMIGDPYTAAFRVAAVIAMGIANVGTIAAQQPGYEAGGYTGDMGVNQSAGMVHGREFVFSAPAVATLGRGNLESMHDAAKAGGSGNGKPTNVNIVALDDRRVWQQMKNNPEADQFFVEMYNRNKWRMG